MDPKFAQSGVDFFKALTWKRVLQLFVVVVIAGASVMFWINKDYISGRIKPATFSAEKPPLLVSDKAKAVIDDTLKRIGHMVNTISVVSVNMERNTRRVIYFVTNDIEIERQNDEFVRTHATTDIPLFKVDDAENNKRIIGLINGEIVCATWEKSAASQYLKNVNVKYTCSVGIPPYYGKFRGTILVFLKAIPDAEETARLRIVMRELSDKLDNPSSSK